VKIINVQEYDCIMCGIEDDHLIVFGVNQGHVVERHVITNLSSQEAGKPQSSSAHGLSEKTLTMIVMVFVAILSILATLLGNLDLAQAILNLLPG
jgi:hypothetical protein